MSVTVEDIRKALSTVEEPDLKKDIITLNMVRDIVIKDKEVSFTIVLTTPACPLKEHIRKSCEEAILNIAPDVHIKISMTADVTTTRSSEPLLPGVKNIIAIASGKGGVGKSTITANLAMALIQSGATVGIIDADIYGPSQPILFDVENERPAVIQENGKNYIIPISQYGVKLISIGFLAPPDSAIVWRGPMASSALRQFISDCKWGELDYMLVDLPPGTSDIHLTLVQTVPLTGAIIVTTPQKVALADAQKALSMFRQPQLSVPVIGVVENMAWFTPQELPENKYYVFGKNGGLELAQKNNVELLGQIPLVQSIRESGDKGKPKVMDNDIVAKAFIEFAEKVARQIAIINAQKHIVENTEINS
ncbi:MAG: Mrp/NBP35 family ATP-binding protein [Cytophagaceae bacterium]|nr:Mrp/NBP35 family ATP-binding protein [Cytophagaceae bacterium]MDW8456102.1 Mrp/NBP35 family ATP-binding protein [Cytophagaceae bacterium]